MTGDVKISSPGEIKAKIQRAAAVLSLYEELVREEQEQISAVQTLAEQAMQTVQARQRGVQTALEQTEQMPDSKPAQYSLRFYRQQLERYAQQQQAVSRCGEALETLRGDHSGLCKKAARLSNEGKLLSRKIGVLIDKIMAAQ